MQAFVSCCEPPFETSAASGALWTDLIILAIALVLPVARDIELGRQTP
jgi:hypothetical protein